MRPKMTTYDQVGNFKVSQLVQYWDEGMRAGYIRSMTLDYASVEPITALKSTKPKKNIRVEWGCIYNPEPSSAFHAVIIPSRETSGMF